MSFEEVFESSFNLVERSIRMEAALSSAALNRSTRGAATKQKTYL